MGSVELAITGFVGVLFACLAVDMGIMMLGNQMLDRATRDAARAAAGQPNQSLALKAANAALANHKMDGKWVQDPVIESGTFVYQDYNGTPSPVNNKNSFVELTCTTQVLLPANLSIFGGKVALGDSGDFLSGKMTFKRHYWFPIVKQTLSATYQ
jgi:Flp pilus assembly protein TadG